MNISNQGLPSTFKTSVVNEFSDECLVNIAGESPLTINIDEQEIVTLMTLGTHPEALVVGYLRNQNLISSKNDLVAIVVNWDRELAKVTTKNGIENLNKKISTRIVTTGCGQGTVFSCTIDKAYHKKLPSQTIKKSVIYKLLKNLRQYNEVYQLAGAVHSCALCKDDKVLIAVEDVGRHNAADTISGLMWIKNINHSDNYTFYTTGRITSEIVIKVAQMGISILLSRSGVTKMGLEIAQDIGMMIIARAKGQHFLVFSDVQRLIFD